MSNQRPQFADDIVRAAEELTSDLSADLELQFNGIDAAEKTVLADTLSPPKDPMIDVKRLLMYGAQAITPEQLRQAISSMTLNPNDRAASKRICIAAKFVALNEDQLKLLTSWVEKTNKMREGNPNLTCSSYPELGKGLEEKMSKRTAANYLGGPNDQVLAANTNFIRRFLINAAKPNPVSLFAAYRKRIENLQIRIAERNADKQKKKNKEPEGQGNEPQNTESNESLNDPPPLNPYAILNPHKGKK